MVGGKMKVVKFGIIPAVIAVYLAFFIFPIKAFYRLDKLPLTPYKPGTVLLVEIPKGFFLLPGSSSLWALKTPDGYNFFRRFNPRTARTDRPLFYLSDSEVKAIQDRENMFAKAEKTVKKSGIFKYDKAGFTPLLAAVRKKDIKEIEALLNNGADVNEFDKTNRYTPLMLALVQRDPNTDLIKLLLDHQADVRVANKDGFNALTLLSNRSNGSVDLAKLLISHGADVNEATSADQPGSVYNTLSKDESPLMLALKHNNSDLAWLYIKNGADLHVQDNREKSLLCYAKDPDIMTHLIDQGLDPNKPDHFNCTPLFYAYSPEIVDILIARGAKIDARNNNGWTPLYWNKKPEVFRRLLDHGGDINDRDKYGKSLLFRVEDPGIYKMLIAKGLDVSERDKRGQTPLHFVVLSYGRSKLEIIQLLLDNGADINAVDNEGRSPLDYAHDDRTRQKLVEMGAISKKPIS